MRIIKKNESKYFRLTIRNIGKHGLKNDDEDYYTEQLEQTVEMIGDRYLKIGMLIGMACFAIGSTLWLCMTNL